MNHIFKARSFFKVPDGTEVCPFMNATDNTQENLPWGSLRDMSIACGQIHPGVASWIHVMPVVTQVTYVVSGELSVAMKSESDKARYELDLAPRDAVLTEAGTFFQLINRGRLPAKVLYIVSPTYVFEMRDGEVIYDDAVLAAKNWEALAKEDFRVPARVDVGRRRAESLQRLAMQKPAVQDGV